MDTARTAALPIVNAPPPPAVTGHHPHALVPHAEIAREAERLWHERGRPAGQDEAIWLEAEHVLRSRTSAPPKVEPLLRLPSGAPVKPTGRQAGRRERQA